MCLRLCISGNLLYMLLKWMETKSCNTKLQNNSALEFDITSLVT